MLKQVNGVWKMKKGAAPHLSPIRGSKELNMMNWERCALLITTHLSHSRVQISRGYYCPQSWSGFKSLVFIALNPEAPNLPLDGFCESDDVEEDVEMPGSGDSNVGSGSESDQPSFKMVSNVLRPQSLERYQDHLGVIR